jgi:hypothetical protein
MLFDPGKAASGAQIALEQPSRELEHALVEQSVS